MDRVAAAAVAVAFAAWLAWTGYVRSEEWIKTGRRRRAGMTGAGYAKWARKHDGEAAEVLLSAVSTIARQATRAARASQAVAGRRSTRLDPDPPDPASGVDPDGAARPDPAPDPVQPTPEPSPAPDPAPDPEPPHPAPEPEPRPRAATTPEPAPVPLGDPMTLANRPQAGEIVGLRAVLAGWARLLTVGETRHAEAGQVTKSARQLVENSEALYTQANESMTVLSHLEAACYQHALEPAALTLVHEAMEAAGAALNAQRRAHNELASAVSSLRTAANANAKAVAAYRDALAYLNRTHRPKAEVEASTGARSDRNFGTT